MYDQEDEIIISLCIIIIASVLQRIQRKKRQREKHGYMPGFRGTGNMENLLFENFEFRHFRPHYLDVDTIFGDLGVNVYQS
jgi:hypothetical protein